MRSALFVASGIHCAVSSPAASDGPASGTDTSEKGNPRAFAVAVVDPIAARVKQLSSLRRHLRGHLDSVRRSLPKRMRFKIGLREQRQIGRTDRLAQRLLIATYWIAGGFQVDPVAMCAGDVCSMLKTHIELLRSSRLMHVEPLCAHVDGDSDVVALGRNIAREKRASNCDGAQRGVGSDNRCFDVHVNLLMNAHWFARFMDNESSGDKLDTSNSV